MMEEEKSPRELFAERIAAEAEEAGFELIGEVSDGTGNGTMLLQCQSDDVPKTILLNMGALCVCCWHELQHHGYSKEKARSKILGIIDFGIRQEWPIEYKRWGSGTEAE